MQKYTAAGALVYSTLIGGNNYDELEGLAVDSADTSSTNFPLLNPIQSLNRGGLDGQDLYVAKLNATGSALVFSTYLGGNDDETGAGLKGKSAGPSQRTQRATPGCSVPPSLDFPTTPGSLQTQLQGLTDLFVAEFNPGGTAVLVFHPFGGIRSESAGSLHVLTSGNILVTGDPQSSNIAVADALKTTLGGASDGFSAELTPDGQKAVRGS